MKQTKGLMLLFTAVQFLWLPSCYAQGEMKSTDGVTGAEISALESYTRHQLHKPKPAYRCEDLKNFTDFKPCKSAVPGAPDPVPGAFSMYGFLSMVYEEHCPEGGCSIEVEGIKVLDSFNFVDLRKALEDTLMSSDEHIAFSGNSSGELFLVSRPRPGESDVPRRYYQVRFISRRCSGVLEWSDPCGFYGDASLIHLRAEGANKDKLTPYFEEDVLSLRLEATMLDYINAALGLSRRFGSDKASQ